MSFVPTSRLLWFVFDAALLGVLGGVFPALHVLWMVALGLLILCALGDVALTLKRKIGVTLTVPSVTRFSRDREGLLLIVLHNESGRAQRIRAGIGLPAEFATAQEDVWVDLPSTTARVQISLACTPKRRGRFLIQTGTIEANSVLGLWHVRQRQKLACECRVHPNLLSERKQMSALFLTRGRDGGHVQRTLGRGREFEKLRDYSPGDGFDEVHWKATAKRGRPITKVYQAERTQEVYVLIDASRLSARSVEHDGINQTTLERYITSALLLLLAARQQGDKFGLIVFDHRVRTFVRANQGSAHYAACREAILELKTSEATPDIPEIMRYLRMHLRQRALLFFLTDLSDPILAEDFVQHVRVLSRQHLMLIGQMRSPEVAPLFSGSEVSTLDDIYGRLAGHERWKENRVLAQKLKPLGVTVVALENETMVGQLVDQYMKIKRRQVL